jgi:hypothetical protein
MNRVEGNKAKKKNNSSVCFTTKNDDAGDDDDARERTSVLVKSGFVNIYEYVCVGDEMYF